MEAPERDVLEILDAAVRSAAAAIEPIVADVDRKLRESPGEVYAWATVPLELYGVPLPESIRSSWVFLLRANTVTGAERHPNSHQRMMSFRGRGDFPTRPGNEWISHPLRSEVDAPLDERWISIPPSVWHQGVIGAEDWAVVSFHTVPDHELIEERPAGDDPDLVRQRRYAESG